MAGLATKKCVPCSSGTAALKRAEFLPLLKQLQGWNVVDDHFLHKTYNFPDFVSALAFVNKIGALAEQEGHHPDLQLSWGKVVIQLWTHKVDGLSECDFILAAKIDELPQG